jgi:cytochrome oxidase Cu insertion factor (SCO1/SenC/PrrC family)
MSEQINKKKSSVPLIMLLLLFLLPVTASWYLVFFTDYARDGEGAEHGSIIKPARQLEDVPLMRVNERSVESVSLYGEWSLLFFIDGTCEDSCAETLYRIRQIRLATGKEMHRIQRVAIINEGDESVFSDYLSKNFPGQHYVHKDDLSEKFIYQFQDQNVNDKMAVFLIDPRGFLMMRYSGDAEPSGIIRDLSRLLRIST